jgi:gamma-tubulin complex component 5
MAHAATRRELVENLVTGVTNITSENHNFVRLCAQSVKGLRDQGHARTNQFTVQARLEGLTEKFGVLNREDLAEALQSCLDELSSQESPSKWLPETLALLLDLSDRPAEKTSRDLLRSAKSTIVASQELTWQEIVAADPLEEDGLWDDVERGYHSSGDEISRDDLASEKAPSTSATSADDGEDAVLLVKPHLIQIDHDLLTRLREKQRQKAFAHTKTISRDEYSVIREVLMMLRGLPTTLFQMDGHFAKVGFSRSIVFTGTSEAVHHNLATEAAEMGTALNRLRRFLRSEHSLAYKQSVQSSVSRHLAFFASQLDGVEASYVSPDSYTIVSVIQVLSDMRRFARPLLSLSAAMAGPITQAADSMNFAYLDSLYDVVCVSQATGDLGAHILSADVFLAGFRTYMQTVARWISTATIRESDQEMFFVVNSRSATDLGSIWHEKFSLRRNADGSASAPQSLQRFAAQIFALGKSKYFLQQLSGTREEEFADTDRLPDLLPSFEATDLEDLDASWKLFPQILEEGINSWIRDLSANYVSQIQSMLLNERGLVATLSALPYVFFAKDGSLFQPLAGGVVSLLAADHGKTSTAKSHLATMLARVAFSSISSIDSHRLHLDTSEIAGSSSSSNIDRLGKCRLSYRVTWPIQNIICSSTPELHSRVFAFLLQVHHARSSLEATFLTLQRSPSEIHATLRLRQRLLWFTDLLHDHITTSANELNEGLVKDIITSGSIESMVDLWTQYTKQLEVTLLLTSSLQPVRESILSILEVSDLLRRARGPASIAGLLAQFDRNLAFLVAGVRGVGRAGGQYWLEAFAERLDWQQRG